MVKLLKGRFKLANHIGIQPFNHLIDSGKYKELYWTFF